VLCYALLAVSLNYEMIWVHVGNGQRGTYELFTGLAVASVVALPSRPARVALGAVWIASTIYIYVGAVNAEFIQSALAWPT
jgi:hypothetical protein